MQKLIKEGDGLQKALQASWEDNAAAGVPSHPLPAPSEQQLAASLRNLLAHRDPSPQPSPNSATAGHLSPNIPRNGNADWPIAGVMGDGVVMGGESVVVWDAGDGVRELEGDLSTGGGSP